MTKHAIKLVTTLIIMLPSCSKSWLDEKPNISSVIPAKLKDAQGLLDNTSIMNSNCAVLGEVGTDGHYVTDGSFPTLGNIDGNAYIWSNDMPYSKVPDWLGQGNIGSYSKVFISNLVLETISKINRSDNIQSWDNVRGQALFQRAKAFYELAQVFAEPYKGNGESSKFGIPLRLESDINIPSVRSSVEQTYKQIINDLMTAKDLLPDAALYKTRASKAAALALLARVYLSIEEYEKALFFSDSCLKLQNNLLDFNNLDVQIAYPISVLNSEVIYHSTLLNASSIGVRCLIDTALMNIYDERDLRKTTFFRTSASGIMFRGSYYGSRLCFNGLATDEQYLIRAECYARFGNVEKAMADLNTLYRNRWDSSVVYIELTANDAEDALRQVLLERRKELLLRGVRWSDLRRLNRDPRFAITLSRTVAGQTYTLEPNSYKYTFPIPDDIIEMTGMPQNPGWEN